MGGLQTVLQLSDPDSMPAVAFLNAVSVDPIGRAAGFQVAWTPDGSRTRLLLFSTNGASIAPGGGPVARICYSVPSGTPPQRFRIFDTATLVSDPEGTSIAACPRRFWIPTFICVGNTACDVNGDGVSDVLDVIRIVHCALGTAGDSIPACPDSVAARADCNADGSVDVRDVICCVRKIVGTGVTFPNPSLPPRTGEIPPGGSSIGFEGAVTWITPVDGIAVLRIDADKDFGGTQFVINSRFTPVRIRALSLDGASARAGTQFESSIDGLGVAHAMLVETFPGARPAHTYRIHVRLERAPSGAGSEPIRIQGVRAGASSGAEAGISTLNSSLVIDAAVVAAPTLLGARPNPTSGATEIAFALPADGTATLRVYDVTGRLVRTLAEGPMTAGVHRARWDGLDARGRAARSGIYFTKLTAGPATRAERILLLR